MQILGVSWIGIRSERFQEMVAHFSTGPVVGFLVKDVDGVRAELQAAGAELIGPVHRDGTSAWHHFRGPDGNVYEINQQAR